MSRDQNNFELPKQLERCLAALFKLYAQEGKRQLQAIVVNSQTRVHEEWTTDNWNGGTYGHALYLVVAEALFLSAAKKRTAIQNQIKTDLNNLHNVQNEFVAEVFLEMEWKTISNGERIRDCSWPQNAPSRPRRPNEFGEEMASVLF